MRLRSTLAGCVLAVAPGGAWAGANHDLMPAPTRIEWQQGSLALDDRFTAASAGRPDARVDGELRRTLARIEAQFGIKLGGAARRSGEAGLRVENAGEGLPVQTVREDESYGLVVTPRGARISTESPLGALRGLATFQQLVRKEGRRVFVPAVVIDDHPRFPWRGLLIDPCRRWHPVEVVKRNLDGMAAVKLNVLHWHLSDDQGFRIESRRFPRLHELVPAIRKLVLAAGQPEGARTP